MINLFGSILALILMLATIPYFNHLVGKSILSTIWWEPAFISKIVLFFIIGTFVTGFYPALVLSSFKPIGILRGNFVKSGKGILIRKGLVMFQFAASFGLIAASLIVYEQISYMTNRDLGINVDQVIGLNNPSFSGTDRASFVSTYKSFLHEIGDLKQVQKVGSVSNLPGGGSADISSSSGGIRIVGMSDRIESTVYMTSIDDQFQEVLDLELLAGRNFNHEFAGGSVSIIVNVSLLNMLNVANPDEVINAYAQFGRSLENTKFQIVGVFDNYNRTTLKSQIEPTVYFFDEATSNTLVKLQGSTITQTMNELQGIWDQFYPNAPFTYAMLDERFEKLYIEDKKLGHIFTNFAFSGSDSRPSRAVWTFHFDFNTTNQRGGST